MCTHNKTQIRVAKKWKRVYQFNIENLTYTHVQKRILMSCFPPFGQDFLVLYYKSQMSCKWNVNIKLSTKEILKKPYANLHLMKFKTLMSYKGGSWPSLRCNNSKIISKRCRPKDAVVGVFIKRLLKMRSYKISIFPIFNPPPHLKKSPFSLPWGQKEFVMRSIRSKSFRNDLCYHGPKVLFPYSNRRSHYRTTLKLFYPSRIISAFE